MNKGVALIVAQVDLGAEHVGVHLVICTVLALVAAVEVSSDPNFLVEVESSSALPSVVVDGSGTLTGVEADVRISAENIHPGRALRKNRQAHRKHK